MTGFRLLKSPAFIVAFLLLVLTAAGMAVLPGYMNVYLRKKPLDSRRHMRAVTTLTASWEQVGQDRQELEDVLKTLGTHNTVTRYYKQRHPADASRPIYLELHLAYYTGMVDTVPHVSDRCMVAGGWLPLGNSAVRPVRLDTTSWRRARDVPPEIADAATLTLSRLPSDPAYTNFPGQEVLLPYGLIVASPETDDRRNNEVPFRISTFEDPNTQAVSMIGHFFIANNRLTPSADDVRQLAFRLTDDYAYYVKVQISMSRMGARDQRDAASFTPADLADVAGGFLSEMLPEIMLCLPDWLAVERERIEAARLKAAG